jgi:MFS family permease
MLPFAVGFFLGSLASPYVVRRLKTHSLAAGFALQVIGFGMVAACVRYQLRGLEEGLACAGIGFGVVMPGVIRAIIGSVDERHAGMASGIVMTTLQIGSALGIAIVGGVFYSVLGTQTSTHAYSHAFSNALACNVVLLAVGGSCLYGYPGRTDEARCNPQPKSRFEFNGRSWQCAFSKMPANTDGLPSATLLSLLARAETR